MAIDKFRGEYSFLSNFYKCDVPYEGKLYSNAESAYQAQKSLITVELDKFTYFTSGKDAKRMSKLIHMRSDWDNVKLHIMYSICLSKFSNNPNLLDKLLATRPHELIEGNTHGDTFWGVCSGYGYNKLGRILMLVRDRLENKKDGD